MTWTQTHISILKTAVNERKNCPNCTAKRPCRAHSASGIGAVIGKSRNAVIGWMHRWGPDKMMTIPKPEMPAPKIAHHEPIRMIRAEVCQTPGCDNPPRRAYRDVLCIACRRRQLNDKLFVTGDDGLRRRVRGSRAIGDRG